MNPVVPKAERDLPGADKASQPGVLQDFSASGQTQQAVQGSGIQNIYLSAHDKCPEPAISVAPPFGQRDENLPIRGRNGLLSELADGDVGPRVWVIHGLGGSGKTRLVLEVAYAAERRGAEVWWVSAADAGTLVAGMRAVGRRLGVAQEDLGHGDAADIIWQQLAARQHPWLLVIDGADDPQMLGETGGCLAEGRGWLRPVTGQLGMVLVTSRDGSATSWGAWCQRHRLGMLPGTEAAAVLADHAGHYQRLGSADDARMLALRLGGLPLALKIAGSYLASSAAIPARFTDAGTITTYQGYREALDAGQFGMALAQPSGQMTQVEVRTLIGRTWELTLDRLDDRQLPEARQILQLLAIFADAPVPYELLLSPNLLAASPVFPGIAGARLWQVINTLDDFGLLELSAATPESAGIGVARVHPLVRDISRPIAESDDSMMFLELASLLLGQAVEAQVPEDPEAWPVLQLLAPHIEEIFKSLAAELDCPDDAAISAAHAAYMLARYRSRQGFRNQAETLFRAVLATQTRILGPDAPSTLATRFELAGEISARGDHAVAEAEYRAVLDARARILGRDNPSTLGTRHQLADEIGVRGDHTTAEAEHRAVLEAQARILGPDSPYTLSTRHCLAHQISARGDHATAEAEHRAVLEAETRILGRDNPTTLSTRNCLAGEISIRGDHATAEAEYRAVLEAETRILGPDNPTTLATRQRLAHEISVRGDHATAEAEYRVVLDARTRILGPDSPTTLAARFELAGEISARGDHATAEAEYRAVLDARTRILGLDSPTTLNTRHFLAHEISARGDHATAEAEHRAVLEAETRILGTDNPTTLRTRHCLAHQISARGDHATAEAEHRAVLEAETRILGPDSPYTLSTRHCLAHQISARGDHATAEAEHRAVLEAETRILGPDNPTTLKTQHCLAGEISARGDHAAAEAEYRAVLDARARILGADNPSTLSTRFELAWEISARGDHAVAEAEYRAVLEAQTRILGPDNPTTLATRYELAGEISARGDHAAAEAEYRVVLDARTRILGPDSPTTLNTRRRIAAICQSAGRLDEAVSLYQSVLADCERALGAEHLLTKSVRSQAANASAQRDVLCVRSPMGSALTRMNS